MDRRALRILPRVANKWVRIPSAVSARVPCFKLILQGLVGPKSGVERCRANGKLFNITAPQLFYLALQIGICQAVLSDRRCGRRVRET